MTLLFYFLHSLIKHDFMIHTFLISVFFLICYLLLKKILTIMENKFIIILLFT